MAQRRSLSEVTPSDASDDNAPPSKRVRLNPAIDEENTQSIQLSRSLGEQLKGSSFDIDFEDNELLDEEQAENELSDTKDEEDENQEDYDAESDDQTDESDSTSGSYESQQEEMEQPQDPNHSFHPRNIRTSPVSEKKKVFQHSSGVRFSHGRQRQKKKVRLEDLSAEDIKLKERVDSYVNSRIVRNTKEGYRMWKLQKKKYGHLYKEWQARAQNIPCLPFAQDEKIRNISPNVAPNNKESQDRVTSVPFQFGPIQFVQGENDDELNGTIRIDGIIIPTHPSTTVQELDVEDDGYEASFYDSSEENNTLHMDTDDEKKELIENTNVKSDLYLSMERLGYERPDEHEMAEDTMDIDCKSVSKDAQDDTHPNGNDLKRMDDKEKLNEIMACRIIPLNRATVPIPYSSAYISVNRNHFVKNDKSLKYSPYFTEEDKTWMEETQLFSDSGHSATEVEEMDDLRISYLNTLTNDYERQQAKESFERIYRLRPNVIEFREKQLNGQREVDTRRQRQQLKTRGFDTNAIDAPLDAFQLLFCPRDGTYDCSIHGPNKPVRRDRAIPNISVLKSNPDPFHTLNMPLDDHNALASQDGNFSLCNDMLPYFLPENYTPSVAYPQDMHDLQPCSEQCYLHYLNREIPGPVVEPEWNAMDESILRMLIPVCRKNICQMKDIMPNSKFSCVDIWRKVKSFIPTLRPYMEDQKMNIDEEREIEEARKKRRARKRQAKFSPLLKDPHETAVQYQPCDHTGPCTAENCDCVKNKRYCEKFCPCPQNCQQRFAGCSCRSGRCRTRACPCFSAHRECDPDLCRACHSYLTPAVMNAAKDWLVQYRAQERLQDPPSHQMERLDLSSSPQPLSEHGHRSHSASNPPLATHDTSPVANASRPIVMGKLSKHEVDSDEDMDDLGMEEFEEEDEDEEMTLMDITQAMDEEMEKEEEKKADESSAQREKEFTISVMGVPGINPFRLCDNINCTHQKKKKLWVGKSRVHGFGCFAGENIKKGDYITEYLGEVITQDEADRRGKVYDKLNLSYLFDLNRDFVVDAMRKGNKIKFANHSKSSPNCQAKIILTNGEQRICVYAKKDIKVSEEIFFDYGHGEHDKGNKPAWFDNA